MKKQIEVQSVTDEIADSIRKIAIAAKAMENSGLKKKTIVILLKDYCGNSVRKDQIETVLHALNALDRVYLQDKK